MISYHAAGTAHLDLFSEYSNLNSDKIAVVQGTETISPFFLSYVLMAIHFLVHTYIVSQECLKRTYLAPGRPVRGLFLLRTPLISVLFVSFNVRQ